MSLSSWGLNHLLFKNWSGLSATLVLDLVKVVFAVNTWSWYFEVSSLINFGCVIVTSGSGTFCMWSAILTTFTFCKVQKSFSSSSLSNRIRSCVRGTWVVDGTINVVVAPSVFSLTWEGRVCIYSNEVDRVCDRKLHPKVQQCFDLVNSSRNVDVKLTALF